jgi:hypothetical protein
MRTVRGVTGDGAGSDVGKGGLSYRHQATTPGLHYPELGYILSVHPFFLRIRVLAAPNRYKAVLLLSHKVSIMYKLVN